MAPAWTYKIIPNSFSDLIETIMSALEAELDAALNSPNGGSHLGYQKISDKLDDCNTFNDDCEHIAKQVCVAGVHPHTLSVYKAADNAGFIFNFYEYRYRDWLAYFHIDFRFNIFTSVLAHNVVNTPPSPLRLRLIEAMEDFRANP